MEEIAPFFDNLFASSIRSGMVASDAAAACANAYLDGKPYRQGRHKIPRAARDACFWNSGFLKRLPSETWQEEAFILAVARYLGQERFSNPSLLEHVAAIAPAAVRQAVRYSGLVLAPHSPRRAEIDAVAARFPDEFAELAGILEIFGIAHRQRVAAITADKAVLAAVSPLEFLVYASLHAFEHWVPRDPANAASSRVGDAALQAGWDAVNDLLAWKLSTAPIDSSNLTEHDIARSLQIHLSPFLFPSPRGPRPRHELRDAFDSLLAAQIELNSFVSQSADAFSYDDSIRFVRIGNSLDIVKLDPSLQSAWARDGEKIQRLHSYWFYRALNEFAGSDMARRTIGSEENHEANRFAFIRAMRSRLRLVDVYGLEGVVSVHSGGKVDLFQALLSLELMSAFYALHFLAPFTLHFAATGSTVQALSRLALHGLRDGSQNRFPLTWSNRAAKIANITGWTVNAEHPAGNAVMAGAILDFWSSDWDTLSALLRNMEPGLRPDLFERPILKMGQMLVELPWLVGIQNNSTAAINNLRRLGARRGEAIAETRRVEQRLGEQFQARGFGVVGNWNPPIGQSGDAGEVDLICCCEGIVFVLEVKSTYLRRSQRDAWLHASTTLRKAGLQLGKKVEAVRQALYGDSALRVGLGLAQDIRDPIVHGWIVDTSLECDHRRFGGFLKVSLEEVLIALRDDRHLLSDSELHGVLAERTLYAEGFSAARFVEVIEGQAVWDEATGHQLNSGAR